jgi:hypothetical protein
MSPGMLAVDEVLKSMTNGPRRIVGSPLTSKSTQSLVGSASVQTVFDAGERSSPIESSGTS